MSTNGAVGKGLATLTLLQANRDSGNDHIGLFFPIVLNSVESLGTEFTLAELKLAVSSRHGLEIPLHSLDAIMTRVCRRGHANRGGGRFHRSGNVAQSEDIPAKRASFEREQVALAQRLRKFLEDNGSQVATDDDALELLLRFLEENQVAMLLDTASTVALHPTAPLGHKQVVLVAKFLNQTFKCDPVLTDYVRRMLEGLVLQNALLLKDIGLAARKFDDLLVVFDSGFLFHALGLAGAAAAAAARETLDLLKASNARIGVFRKTIAEVKSILSMYERKLGTQGEARTLRQTDVTRHFLTNHYTPSDVSQVLALLDLNIRQLGFSTFEYPERKAKYTLDERALAQALMRPGETELEPRIVHDVDCVASILTMRAGRQPELMEGAGYVFVTTTGLVVRNVTKWFRDSGETGVSPIAHLFAITSLAWLKKPAAAGKLKLNELIALCAAAIRPTQGVWNTFLQKLRKMEEAGEISSPEYLAIVASRLLDSKLSEYDDETSLDSRTIADVVTQVKAEYSKAADALVVSARSEADKETEARVAADKRALEADEARRQLELRVYGLTDLAARSVAGSLFYGAIALVILGFIFGLPGLIPNASPTLTRAAWIILVAAGILGVVDVGWGKSIQDHRRDIETALRLQFRNWISQGRA